jgi:hypothetical protein
MTFMTGDPEDDFAIPAGTEGSAGPRTGFLQNFEAAYTEQAHVNSALGAAEDMSNLEQQQLDKLYSLTGERLSPLFPGAWSSGDLSASPQFAIMHNLNGDQLDAEQRAFVAAAQDQIQHYDKLAATHGLLTYDQMFKQVQQNAQQDVGNAASVGDRSTAMGWLGGALGSAAGSLTYRDPVNLASLALGGPGKTMIARVIADMGIQGLSHMVDLLTGAAENQQLLTGKAPTFGEELEQSAETGIGAGVFRAGGEAIAHGFGAIARRFGAKAPDITAGAVAQEAEHAIGPSPYGPSRVAEGMHTADVLDALARDVPLNQRPVAGRLVDPAVGGDKFPMAPLASPAADALFTDTAKPLANLFDSVPATPEMDRANAALSDITAEIAKADADATAARDTFATANGGRTIEEEQRRLVSAFEENRAAQTALNAKGQHVFLSRGINEALGLEPRTVSPTEDAFFATVGVLSNLHHLGHVVDPEFAEAESKLVRERGALEADWARLRTALEKQEGAAAAASYMRLVRARMVDAIAEAIPNAPRSAGVQALLDRAGVGSDSLRPIDRPVSSSSTSDEIERMLDQARREPAAAAPRARIIPAIEPDTPDMMDIGWRSGPVNLDTPIAVGVLNDWETSETPAPFEEFGRVRHKYRTLRQIIQEHADDDALIKAMNECLIA